MKKKIIIKMDNKIKEVVIHDRGQLPKPSQRILDKKTKQKIKRVKIVNEDYHD